MKAWMPILGCALLVCIGCAKQPRVPIDPFTFNHYVAENFDWPSIKRVLVMPMDSPRIPPAVTTQIRQALIAELQRDGRFEIVIAPDDIAELKSDKVFASGQFDEVELLYVSRKYQVQGVLFGRVTTYHAYPPPRIGMSLMLTSPAQAVVVASLDGMWDGREQGTVERTRQYFNKNQSWPQSLLGAERVLNSPDVFQRFVCNDVARTLRELVDSREGRGKAGRGGPNGYCPPDQMPGAGAGQMVGQPVTLQPLPPGAILVPNGQPMPDLNAPQSAPWSMQASPNSAAPGPMVEELPAMPHSRTPIPSSRSNRTIFGTKRDQKSLDYSPAIQPFRPVPTPKAGGARAAQVPPELPPTPQAQEASFQQPITDDAASGSPTDANFSAEDAAESGLPPPPPAPPKHRAPSSRRR